MKPISIKECVANTTPSLKGIVREQFRKHDDAPNFNGNSSLQFQFIFDCLSSVLEQNITLIEQDNGHEYPTAVAKAHRRIEQLINSTSTVTVKEFTTAMIEAIAKDNFILVRDVDKPGFIESKSIAKNLDYTGAEKALKELIPQNLSKQEAERYIVMYNEDNAKVNYDENIESALVRIDNCGTDSLSGEPMINITFVAGVFNNKNGTMDVSKHIDPDMTDDIYMNLNEEYAQKIAKEDGVELNQPSIDNNGAPTRSNSRR